ncbi:sigma-70 family RNA polymerase sigma factor [Metabacillus idriensis]|uniref:RNA polymerase sigma factor n=1 Tax=Metabacillus idriensis TaxID=324768 RepID=UPI0008A92DEC|nr:sigma-70 family RNA polymerase sigma factor [Metabacillus idriensis]MCM3598157.1 sigma-70 family RNA polymerase sigma factor [Metabacillus idriensis]OHR63745.1 hypothetical protein HMPREF3291_03460 [Bacillus sp. HMSC76G11]
MDNPIYLQNNIDSILKEKFQSFYLEYEIALSNPIIKSFLSNENYYQIFISAICFPSQENINRLDNSFQIFFTEIRLIYYISKHLSYFARHYNSKISKNSNFFLLILDQPFKNNDSNEVTYKDLIDESCDVVLESITAKNRLLDYFQSPILYGAFNQLTNRQINILEFYYINGYTHTEIATILDISQQAVSKTLRRALQKLKDYCQREEDQWKKYGLL